MASAKLKVKSKKAVKPTKPTKLTKPTASPASPASVEPIKQPSVDVSDRTEKPTPPVLSVGARPNLTIARTRKRPSPKIHIREAAKKDAETLCGGSHSPIWNRDGERPLETVSPQAASKATCGRCIRVAKRREIL